MGSEERLRELSRQLEGTVNRMKELETKPSFINRVKHHLNTQGGYLTNAILAGCVLSVALGRLGMKQKYEAEKEELREQIMRLEVRNATLEEEATKLRMQKQNIQNLVRRELDNGGWRLSTVASRLRSSMLGGEEPEKTSSATTKSLPPEPLQPEPSLRKPSQSPSVQSEPARDEAKLPQGKKSGLMI